MDFKNKNMSITWLVAIVFFMELLDTTIINTSIPQIAHSFEVPIITIKTAITSYLLSLAIFIPISGWLADRFGAKNVFSTSILIFTVSSLLCGLSTSILELTIFRALQGIGGAMMTPVGKLVVIRAHSQKDLVKIMGYITVPALFAPISGPLLGGFITTYYSWHWIFFINIPLGIICFFFSQKLMENEKDIIASPFDKWGFILSALALSTLSFSFESLSENIISKNMLTFLLLLGFTCSILYIYHAKRVKNPLLNLNLLKIRSFLVANLLLIIGLMSMGGINFLLPILYQSQFGLTPIQSGILTFPIAVGALLMRPFVPKIIEYFGYKKVIIFSSIICSISLMLFTFIKNTNSILIIAISTFFGLWYVLQLSTIISLGYKDIGKDQKSNATSFQSTTQQFAMSIGICFSALLLHTFLLYSGADLGSMAESKAVVFSFHNCFIVMSSLCLVSSLVALLLKPDEGICTHAPNTNSTNKNKGAEQIQQEKTA